MLRFLLQGTCYKGRIKVVDVDEGLKTTSLVPGLHTRCEMRTYMWIVDDIWMIFGWQLSVTSTQSGGPFIPQHKRPVLGLNIREILKAFNILKEK